MIYSVHSFQMEGRRLQTTVTENRILGSWTVLPTQKSGHRDKKRDFTAQRFCCVHLKEHSAVLFCIGWLNVIWCAGVSAARWAHDGAFPWFPLKTASQAAATCTELLRLLKPRILQDALRKRSSAAQAFTWIYYSKFSFQSQLCTLFFNFAQFMWNESVWTHLPQCRPLRHFPSLLFVHWAERGLCLLPLQSGIP